MDSLQWQSFLKSCLDILRNGDSKYDGLKAINEFITLITLKLVEHRIYEIDNELNSDDDKIRIGLDCKFTNLYNDYCIFNSDDKLNKAKKLFDLLYNHERMWDIEDTLDDDLNHVSQVKKRNNKLECVIHRFNKYTKELNKLTDNIIDVKTLTTFTKEHKLDVQKLVIKIQETFGDIDIEHFTYDAFGDAYEKMIADELGNGSKRNGQYFTKRDLIKYIINELNIKNTDICYDPACGTGGFLLGFASKFKNNKDFIKNNIYGQEYLYEVYKTLNFNILANNYDNAFKNISNGDSISNEYYHEQIKNKFDIVGANPPFGLSIETCPKEYPIKVKNSVALFLQHIYFSLKNGGRAGIIIDRGILNNGTDKKNAWESKLRKFLLEKTSITKIINLPTGIFKHTNFATSVIFFTKGLQTTEIKYIEGYYKNEDKGKGDKTMHFNKEKILTINEIKNKNYSLKYDDYFKVIDNKQENTNEWIKLGDVCEILLKSKHKAADANENGMYNFYTSSSVIKKSNYNDYKDISIIIGSGGNGSLFIDKNFSCSADNFILKINNSNIKYIYYYLKINFNKLYELYKGQGLKHLSLLDLKKFLIPNLSIEHQEEIVKFLDEIYQTAKIEDTIKYLKDKPIFNLLIDKNYDGFKNIIFFQENIPKLIYELENIPKKKILQVQSIFKLYCNDAEIKKLGDIVERIKGNFNSGDMDNNGDIPFYTASVNSPVGTHSKYTINKEEYIIFAKDGGNKTNPLSLTSGIAKSYYVQGKSAIASHSVAFIPNNNIKCKYLYYYLIYYRTLLMAKAKYGSGLGHISLTDITEFEIPIPSIKKQEEIVNKIEELEKETSHYNQYAKMLQTELNNINEIISIMTIKNDSEQINKLELENINENIDNNSDNQSEENNNDQQIIEYKNKTYILENDKIYKINDNGDKGEQYGNLINGKVKKIKSDKEISI